MKKECIQCITLSKTVLFFCAIVQNNYELYLSAEYQFVNPVQNDVLFGTKSLFCVQNAFCAFCTNRTFLYENRAMCKYLIFNVINEEK